MKALLPRAAAVLTALGFACASSAQSVPRAEDTRRVEQLVATLAQEAATLCPLSDPADQDALDRCRLALFKNSFFKRSLARIVLWGRPSPVPDGRLKDTTLTQFGAEVLSGLYLPLFMFNGRYRVEYDATETRYRARLEAVFRNNLMPGQYPYPFWHDANKWNDYQRANGLTLWIDPYTSKVVVGQFTPLFLGLAFELLPVAFDSIPVHRCLLSMANARRTGNRRANALCVVEFRGGVPRRPGR